MTIKDCIDLVDNQKPNQYTIKEKVMWLSFIDEIIINEVLKTHEGYDGRYDDFTGYTEDKLSVALIVPSPYDRLYPAYLKMKIDGENGETARYNSSSALYNSYMLEFRKHYNKTHMPLTSGEKKPIKYPTTTNAGLTEAELDNLKKELTFILTEYFSNTISEDKVYDVVNKFVQNNIQMLKGKDGKTPVKGFDYFTDKDKKEFATEVINEFRQTAKLSDLIDDSNDINPINYARYAATCYEAENVTGEVKNALFAQYATKDYINNIIHETYATKFEVGSIETALDGIIAIQNQLMGVTE